MKSNDNMGMSKHRKSGKSPKSPKLRHAIKREAEKNSVSPQDRKMCDSVDELFNKR